MMHPMRHMGETTDEHARDRRQVMVRLLRYMSPYRTMVMLSLILTIISAAGQGAGPYLIGLAIDQFISAGDRAGLARTMVALFGVYFISMIAMRYQIYTMSVVAQRVLSDLRKQIIEQVERMSIQEVESRDTGDLMSRLVNDIDTINSFFSQGLAQSVGALFALVGIVIAMLVMSWPLALAALSVVPVMLVATRQFAQMARRAFRKTRSTIGDVSADLQEELGGVKVAQAFNRSEMNVRRFAERNAANRDANVSANAVTSAFAPAMDVLSTLDIAIVAGYGGYLAVQGAVSVGVVVAFLQYVQNFFRPIQTVASIWTVAQSAFAGAERVFDLLDAQPKVQDAPNAAVLPPLQGCVTFEDVTFRYSTERGEQPVLLNVSFTAQPGQTVALVGPTGAGKTTTVGLIMRFFDVTSGRVSIDGFDVRQVTQHSLRSQMAMVLQDPFLFSGTILENIRYGRLEAVDEEVIQAAQAANAHGFIERLPQGYQTQVGERGGMLSQGQRQLISIARAVLADPRILILDEATASVDTRTEVLIQKALNQLLKGRTSFVIAHRLSTVRNADQILVFDNGQIVDRGTHTELLDHEGLYAELYQRQFFGGETLIEQSAPSP